MIKILDNQKIKFAIQTGHRAQEQLKELVYQLATEECQVVALSGCYDFGSDSYKECGKCLPCKAREIIKELEE